MGRNGLRRVAGFALIALGCAEPAPVVELDAPSSPAPVVVSSAPEPLDCARCHARIAAEHARSLHALAATDPLYLREVELVSDRAFCDGCHGTANEPPGIGCATCHVRDGVVLASERTGRAPHAVVVEPALSTDGSCAPCHQFDFPHRPGEPMQRTLEEAATLGADRATCISCHFAAGHDVRVTDDALAAALRIAVTARRGEGHTRVRFVLRAAEVGHAVPTGDLYRRLEIRAWLAGTPDTARTATLAREMRPEADGLHEIRDGRVPPPGGGARTVDLTLPADEARVRWSIDWLALPRARGEHSGIPEGWWRRPVATGSLRAE